MPAEIIKFDDFELDLGRYELRRGGHALKLEKVPMELLILLAEREGQLVTREEIVERLWGKDVFVDTRQGINTAVRKLRLALKDDPDEPRIVQTVFGKGYRLAALPGGAGAAEAPPSAAVSSPAGATPAVAVGDRPGPGPAVPAASPSSRPVSSGFARGLFLVIQAGYLALYAAAFVYFPGIRRLGVPEALMWFILVTGLIGAAVRLYLASAVGFNFAGSGRLFHQIFPGVLALDAFWAAAPLLLFNQLGELTLLGVAALAFLPFSQRSLIIWTYGPRRADASLGAKAQDRSQAPAA